ncbi:aminopeptidase P N-terminal domain-containing protein [Picosynechococcus sp. NKBG15041c]|uniref:aminopeptidase P N-terminal domain-containing protein n=1 Tax=Picosynechococcus sp. NKBG15041c TaxID=1407650 RepID=UPI0004185243|nr:aminopeptidase P N-terminal domain-containing protein [Picosynechococcus sp. NKBG15041c]
MAITAQEYQQRRQTFMAKLGQGTAIFRSAPHAVMHNDVEYNFRQDSDFYYLTGFNEPNAVAVFAPHHLEHQFILFVQPKDLAEETWVGYRAGVEGAQEKFGADIAYSIHELAEKLPDYLKGSDRLFYHFGRDEKFNQTILQHYQRLLATRSKRGTGPTAIADPGTILHPMRMVKSEAELALTRRATAISAKAHLWAMEYAKPGLYEYQVQAEIEHLFRLEGAAGFAYPSIVAGGANACVLHYVENNAQLQDNELLLIDAGACYEYYNGDITRTFPVGDRFTPEQRVLYELVLEAQKQAIAAVKPGNSYQAPHQAAVRVITHGLRDLGLLRGNLEELIEGEKYKPFFMHGTGHWLGLDVHDAGIYKIGPEKDDWTTFSAGNVVTVEPGIYISPYIQPAEGQPEIADHWQGIGIRIEDDVLVTATGNDVLTAAVPKEVKDLEA